MFLPGIGLLPGDGHDDADLHLGERRHDASRAADDGCHEN